MKSIRVVFPWLSFVNSKTLRADALAGLLSALLVLPQGIAFAHLAGMPIEYGLYSAIVPCIVGALFGSSWHVVTGPTNANSLALFSMIAPLAVVGGPQYIEIVLAVTIMVGVVQFLVGALKLGAVANFISPTALLGFMSGAAILIGFYALKDALGLVVQGLDSFSKLTYLVEHIPDLNIYSFFIALATLVTAVLVKLKNKHLPFMLIGLIAGSILGWLINNLYPNNGVSFLGELISPIPPFHIPQINFETIPDLMGVVAALTVVALAQSISIAKAVAERSGQRIDGNREFLGQGLANIAGGFFSSYIACGSLNRSMPNLESGARTPLASVMAGLLIVPLVALFGNILAYIPYAAISGLLILVAWNLFDLNRWKWIFKVSRTEFSIAAITLIATIFARLEIAVLIGSALSLGAYLQRSAKPAMRTMGFDAFNSERQFVVADDNETALPECPQFKLLRMEGSIYFGAVTHVADGLQEIRDLHPNQKHLLVMTKSMNFVDIAGSELWLKEMTRRRSEGGDLYFHRPRPPVMEQWKQDGFLEALGEDHIYPDKRTAISSIYQKLDKSICETCKVKAFWECRNEGLG